MGRKPTAKPIVADIQNKRVLVIGEKPPSDLNQIADHAHDDYLSLTGDEVNGACHPFIVLAPTRDFLSPAQSEREYQDFHQKKFGKPDNKIPTSYWEFSKKLFSGADWEDLPPKKSLSDGQRQALATRRAFAKMAAESVRTLILKAINGAYVFLLIPSELASWKIGRELLLNWMTRQINIEPASKQPGYFTAGSSAYITSNNPLSSDMTRTRNTLIQLYKTIDFKSLLSSPLAFKVNPYTPWHAPDSHNWGLKLWLEIRRPPGIGADVSDSETHESAIDEQLKRQKVFVEAGHMNGKNHPMSILFTCERGGIILMPAPSDLSSLINHIRPAMFSEPAPAAGSVPPIISPGTEKTGPKTSRRPVDSDTRKKILDCYTRIKNEEGQHCILIKIHDETGYAPPIIKRVCEAKRKRDSRIIYK